MDNFDIGKFNVGFIGGGNMATAIATPLLKKNIIAPSKIWVTALTEKTKTRWKTDLNVNIAKNTEEIFKNCNIVILAVKPQVLDEALAVTSETSFEEYKRTIVISVLVGTSLDTLKQKLHNYRPLQIIRTMPNTPLMVGEGIIVYSYNLLINYELTNPDYKDIAILKIKNIEDKLMTSIFSTMGIVEKVPEKLINPISALSGSGPAYVYLMIEGLADGAVRMGVPREMANKYAAQIMVGAGQMVLQTGKHPGLLKDEVCSPNGTTITGIHALERGGVRGHLMNAVEAATKRSNELS